MNKQAAFVNRFKYTILAILTVVTVVYGYYLYKIYMMPPPAPVSIPVTVTAAGAVQIEGTVYTTADTLKGKVAAIQNEHPKAGFAITAAPDAAFEPVAKAVTLLKQSGANEVWVLNEPKDPSGSSKP